MSARVRFLRSAGAFFFPFGLFDGIVFLLFLLFVIRRIKKSRSGIALF